MGVYDKVPGDGRELAVTDPGAVTVRAEDGRPVSGVDISPFISSLPSSAAATSSAGKSTGTTASAERPGVAAEKSENGDTAVAGSGSGADGGGGGGGNVEEVTTERFSTGGASGSTSQAANVVEALEAGATALLLDEDTCAGNVRGRRGCACVRRIHLFIALLTQQLTENAFSDGSRLPLLCGLRLPAFLPCFRTKASSLVFLERPRMFIDLFVAVVSGTNEANFVKSPLLSFLTGVAFLCSLVCKCKFHQFILSAPCAFSFSIILTVMSLHIDDAPYAPAAYLWRPIFWPSPALLFYHW